MKQEYNQFRFVGMNSKGKKKRGVIVAPSSREVIRYLHEFSITPLQIKKSTWLVSRVREGYLKFISMFRNKNRLKYQIYGQIGGLLDANYTLNKIILSLTYSVKQADLKFLLNKILVDVESGFSLSFAFKRHMSHIISNMENKLIEHGEKVANLDVVFMGLKSHYGGQLTSRGKMILWLIPLMGSLFATVLTINGIVAFYGPYYEREFYLLRMILPASADLLFTIFKGNLAVNVALGFVLFVLASYALKLIVKFPKIKQYVDYGILKVPYVSEIIRLKALVQFITGFGLSIKSHIPLQEALKDAVGLIKQYKYRRELDDVIVSVFDGLDVSAELARCSLFKNQDLVLISTAIQSGNLKKDIESLLTFAHIKLKFLNLIISNLIRVSMILLMAFLIVLTATAFLQIYYYVGI